MDPASLSLGVLGLTFQFFHAGKEAYNIISEARSTAKDAKVIQTRVRIEREKHVNTAGSI
jgi:hypothetical protein